LIQNIDVSGNRSRIGLGTAQFGQDYGMANTTGAIDQTSALPILEYAVKSGIDTIDTARAYGESETILGETLSNEYSQIKLFQNCRI